MEVWGFEPQTYGLQSHRSSQLSYTPENLWPRRPHEAQAKGARDVRGTDPRKIRREKGEKVLEPEVRPMRAQALAQLTELARLAPTAIGGVSNTHCGAYAEVLPSAPPPRPFRPFARVAPSSSSVRLSGLRRCPSQGKRLFRPSGREHRIRRTLPCLVHGTKLALKRR